MSSRNLNSRKPINSTLIRGSILFISLACLILGVVSYLLFSSAFYKKNQEVMKNVITYIEHKTDADDLYSCLKTKKRSQKYKQLQQELDLAVDDLGTEYIYIGLPNYPEKGLMTSVIASANKEKRKAGEKDMGILKTTDAYDDGQLAAYEKAARKSAISFFETESDFGRYYTACKPIHNSEGKMAGLICVDIAIDNVKGTVSRYVYVSVAITVMIGVLFMVILIYWMRKNVTDPVLRLERSARHFAMQSKEGMDPSQLYFDVPEILVNNEVQSLSETIEQLSYDMKNYVEGIVSAEERASSAEQEALGMSRIAYQDALTRVKSKAAFDVEKKELSRQIKEGKEPFAIVMMDLNDLKKMNDAYGHDMGDRYLIGGCKQMCVTFNHSPVFRLGGDEFIAVLREKDYEDRNLLLAKAKSSFRDSSQDNTRAPWERYSAAIGLAEHLPGDSETVQDVLKRADEEMYKDKKRIKASREIR